MELRRNGEPRGVPGEEGSLPTLHTPAIASIRDVGEGLQDPLQTTAQHVVTVGWEEGFSWVQGQTQTDMDTSAQALTPSDTGSLLVPPPAMLAVPR